MKIVSKDEAISFIRAHTQRASTPLLPEIELHLATEITPLWQATEAEIAASALPPPYWAFAWVGGQALARHVLDHPAVVRGKRVLDFAAGSGVVGIAAAMAGAAQVEASEIDAFAAAAIELNAAANGVTLLPRVEDLTTGVIGTWEVVLAGYVCYERPMAAHVVTWLSRLADSGTEVLLGDPGRAYLPERGLRELARYTVPTTRELEDNERREVGIFRLVGS